MSIDIALFGLISVIVIIAVLGVLLYVNNLDRGQSSGINSKGPSGSASNAPSSTINSLGIQSSGPNPSNSSALNSSCYSSDGYINSGGGPGQSYMNKSQAESLFGTGGQYCSTGQIIGNNTKLYIHEYDSNASLYSNTITAVYLMSYATNSTSNPNFGVSAIAFTTQSSKATQIYDEYLSNATVGGIPQNLIVNATLNGMVYSYENSTQYFNATTLIGYKGNEEVSVIVLGKVIGQQELASVVAEDLPS